mgnify:CR=1 FL=1
MSGIVRIGLALTSDNVGVLATAEFDNVSVLGGGQGSDTEAPTQPQNLQAVVTSDTAIDLSWDASSDNTGVTGYNVYLSTDLTTPLNGSLVVGLANTVTGLTAATAYDFQITALDAAGNESTPSAAVNATTDAAPDTEAPTQPQTLQAAAASDTAIDLSWAASSDNTGVTGYNVYLSSDLTTPLNGSPVAGLAYTVTCLTWASSFSVLDTALDGAGYESTPSAEVIASSDAGPDTEAPTQPQNLQAAVTSDTAIDLSWDASSDNTGVTGYNVYLSTDLTTPLNGSPVADLTYTVTALTADTPYSFQVTALDAAGNESTPAAAVNASTDAAP